MFQRPSPERTAGDLAKMSSSMTNPAESAGKKLTATMAHRATPAGMGWRVHAGRIAHGDAVGGNRAKPKTLAGSESDRGLSARR